MTDYRSLLLRYMRHVGDVEGTDFTGRSLDGSSAFTIEEKALLRALSTEADPPARLPPAAPPQD